MTCGWFIALAGVWLDATVTTTSVASIERLHNVANEGTNFIARLRVCNADVTKVEARVRALIDAAHKLEDNNERQQQPR